MTFGVGMYILKTFYLQRNYILSLFLNSLTMFKCFLRLYLKSCIPVFCSLPSHENTCTKRRDRNAIINSARSIATGNKSG